MDLYILWQNYFFQWNSGQGHQKYRFTDGFIHGYAKITAVTLTIVKFLKLCVMVVAGGYFQFWCGLGDGVHEP